MHKYRKELLNEAGAFDGFIAFKFVQLLTKPFEEWEAFKLGLIDEKGKTLKKPKTSAEKKSYGLFERLVKNMKVLMSKMPGGSSKIASYAAALFLLKEEYNLDQATTHKLMECVITYLEDQGVEPEYPHDNTIKILRLAEGRYELSNGETVFVRKDLFPEHQFLGVDLYLSENNTTGKPMLFAFEEIQEEF